MQLDMGMISEELIQHKILDYIKEGVCVRDLDKNILYINKASEKITGFSREEALGRKCYEIFGDHGEQCKGTCHLDKIIHDDSPHVCHEGELKNRSGEQKNVRITVSSLQEGEAATGAIIFVEDRASLNENNESYVKASIQLNKEIELRKSIEQTLKDSAEFLNDLLLISPVAMGIVERGRIMWINDTLCSLFGAEKSIHFHEAFFETIFSSAKDYSAIMKKVYDDRLCNEKFEWDLPLKRKDGSIFEGHLMMKHFYSPESDDRVIFTVEDISRRKQTEKEKRREEKLEGVIQLAGAVCHELNQPLQALTGFLSLLKERASGLDPNDKYLKIITEQVVRMHRLTVKLMHITHVQTKDYLDSTIMDIDRSIGEKEEWVKQWHMQKKFW